MWLASTVRMNASCVTPHTRAHYTHTYTHTHTRTHTLSHTRTHTHTYVWYYDGGGMMVVRDGVVVRWLWLWCDGVPMIGRRVRVMVVVGDVGECMCA